MRIRVASMKDIEQLRRLYLEFYNSDEENSTVLVSND